MAEKILDVRHLVSEFATEHGLIRVVDGLSLTLEKGKTLALVGESGSGKTVTALSLIDLLPKPMGRVVAGEILFRDQNLRLATDEELHRIRGRHIAMVFQEPMSSLNPVKKIGKQLAEVFRIHFPEISKKELRRRCEELLIEVGIPAAEQRLDEYPHQLSGGMRQRVTIAMALAGQPEILIADEPTTALDVTIQAQILELLQNLQKSYGMAILLITHDLGVVAEMAHEVAVMYGGRLVEFGSVLQIFQQAKHPYTQGLLASMPRLSDQPKSFLPTIEGAVSSIHEMPEGCCFQNRCPYLSRQCRMVPPAPQRVNAGHQVSCYHWREIAKRRLWVY